MYIYTYIVRRKTGKCQKSFLLPVLLFIHGMLCYSCRIPCRKNVNLYIYVYFSFCVNDLFVLFVSISPGILILHKSAKDRCYGLVNIIRKDGITIVRRIESKTILWPKNENIVLANNYNCKYCKHILITMYNFRGPLNKLVCILFVFPLFHLTDKSVRIKIQSQELILDTIQMDTSMHKRLFTYICIAAKLSVWFCLGLCAIVGRKSSQVQFLHFSSRE